MNKSDKYLSFPLALLRASQSPKAFFNEAARYAAVNAGIAYEKLHGTEQLKRFASELLHGRQRPPLPHSVVGAAVCGVELADPTGARTRDAYQRMQRLHPNSPTLRVCSEWFWAAAQTARGDSATGDGIRWDEFRIIVAILSAKPNRYGFAVLGWEAIQRRACGFHNRSDFENFEEGPEQWPEHCLPMGREAIRRRLARLESLGFFLRHAIRQGARGGRTAYSFRHSKGSPDQRRAALAADCEAWQAFYQGFIARENRAKDALMHEQARSRRVRKVIETEQAARRTREATKAAIGQQKRVQMMSKTSANPHESSKQPTANQTPTNSQHNMGSNITINTPKIPQMRNPQTKALVSETNMVPSDEQRGYRIGNIFIPDDKINDFASRDPGRLVDIAKNAVRCTRPLSSMKGSPQLAGIRDLPTN